MLECQCKQEENLCDLCCKKGEDGECKPIRNMGVSNITNAIQQFPGAPCDNFNGYCDVFLKCRAVDADGPLSRLKNKFFSKEAILGYLAWIKEHWWAVLLMGIGLILLMAGKIYHSCCRLFAVLQDSLFNSQCLSILQFRLISIHASKSARLFHFYISRINSVIDRTIR